MNTWVFVLLGIAALYSITVFIVQVVRYFLHRKEEQELLDDDLDSD